MYAARRKSPAFSASSAAFGGTPWPARPGRRSLRARSRRRRRRSEQGVERVRRVDRRQALLGRWRAAPTPPATQGQGVAEGLVEVARAELAEQLAERSLLLAEDRLGEPRGVRSTARAIHRAPISARPFETRASPPGRSSPGRPRAFARSAIVAAGLEASGRGRVTSYADVGRIIRSRSPSGRFLAGALGRSRRISTIRSGRVGSIRQRQCQLLDPRPKSDDQDRCHLDRLRVVERQDSAAGQEDQPPVAGQARSLVIEQGRE